MTEVTDFEVHDLPGVIVVTDDPVAAAAAERAVGQATARVVATFPWRGAHAGLATNAPASALLLEAIDVDDTVLERELPILVEAAGAVRVVVTFTADQLDQVGGVLIGSNAQLLCEPTEADRVAALIIALNDDVSEVGDSREEAARLARINAEIARFTETLAKLTGAPQGERAAHERDPIVGDRRIDFGQPPAGDSAVTPAEVRRAIRARRLRDEVFGLPGLFEDPAWDMMLDLFAAELEDRSVSVSSLCIAAAVAPTTALRWINKLIAVGLFERRPDDLDRRRAFIALSSRGSQALRDYMTAIRRAGLAIA